MSLATFRHTLFALLTLSILAPFRVAAQASSNEAYGYYNPYWNPQPEPSDPGVTVVAPTSHYTPPPQVPSSPPAPPPSQPNGPSRPATPTSTITSTVTCSTVECSAKDAPTQCCQAGSGPEPPAPDPTTGKPDPRPTCAPAQSSGYWTCGNIGDCCSYDSLGGYPPRATYPCCPGYACGTAYLDGSYTQYNCFEMYRRGRRGK